jgi:signal transduction histidine kinase
LAIGIFSSLQISRLAADNQWVIHTHQVLERLADASLHLASMQSEVRGYVATGDQKYLGAYSDHARGAQNALDSLRELTRDNPRQQWRMDKLQPLSASLHDLLEREVKARSEAGVQPAESIIRTSGGLETMSHIQDLISEMNDEETSLLAQRDAEVRTRSLSTIIVLIAGGILALGIVIAAVWRANAELAERQLAQEQVESLNSELNSRAAELADINRELEAFTYSVAHDLRAPLRHVDGFSQILDDEYRNQLPADAQQLLSDIRNSAKGMGTLIDELLKLSRLGRKELALERVELKPMIERVVQSLGPEATDRRIEWRLNALSSVECDPNLMEQVFVNLLSNAVKYTRTRDLAVIEVKQQVANREQIISVADNGVGFNMKYADKLFGVFQRLHRADEFEGTGIGLATVQRIIHKHNGKIWAESEMDRGATFSFSLPERHAVSQ